jgi:phage baseplate assembly protein W
MPLIHHTKKINPLDLNSNVRIGVAFPLNDLNMTSGTETTHEQLKSNFLNLLLTVPGERINHPNYGVGLKNQVFENNINDEDLKDNINAQCEFWIPQIRTTGILVKRDIDKYMATLKVSYKISLDETEDAIQINYK